MRQTIERAATKAGVSVEEFAKLPRSEQNAFLIETKADAEHPENGAPTKWAAPGVMDRSPFNRDEFDQEEMAKLRESVRLRGVLDPLWVRPIRYRAGFFEKDRVLNSCQFEFQVGPTGTWTSIHHRFNSKRLDALIPGDVRKSTTGLLTVEDCKRVIPFLPQFEIIAGERRHIAATAEKASKVPIRIFDVDDEEAIELQGIENLQRENLNPIHEAQKYQQLLDLYHKRGLDPAKAMDRLEEKIGKAKSTIYEALRLLKLPPKTKEATLKGLLPRSHAGQITKLEKRPDLMEEATAAILKPRRHNDTDGKVLSFRETRQLIDQLEERAKNDVEFNRVRDAFVKKCDLVLSPDDNKKVFPYSSDHVGDSSQFVDPDGWCTQAGKTWGQAMGKHKPDPVLARAPSGKPVIVYAKTQAIEAVKRNAPRGQKITSRSTRAPSEVARERSHRARVKVFNGLLERVAERGRNMDGPEIWRFIFDAVSRFGQQEFMQRVAKRRGVVVKERYKLAEGLRAQLKDKPAKDVRGAVAELLFCRFAPSSYSKGWDRDFEKACALFGVPMPDWKQTSGMEEGGHAAAAQRGLSAISAVAQLPTPSKRKRKSRGLTEAAQRKLSEAMKARWAARRKAAR